MNTNSIPLEESRVREIVRDEIKSILHTEQERLLGLPEAAAFIDCSKSTLYRLTSKKEVPHFKCRGKILFDRKELTAWRRAGKQVSVETLN
jgi:excisionase family DNA binding protein